MTDGMEASRKHRERTGSDSISGIFRYFKPLGNPRNPSLPVIFQGELSAVAQAQAISSRLAMSGVSTNEYGWRRRFASRLRSLRGEEPIAAAKASPSPRGFAGRACGRRNTYMFG